MNVSSIFTLLFWKKRREEDKLWRRNGKQTCNVPGMFFHEDLLITLSYSSLEGDMEMVIVFLCLPSSSVYMGK